jgi:hypothetical protein
MNKNQRQMFTFFKSKNFDKLIEYYWKENGAVSGKNFDNAWSKARNKAIRFTELQLDEKIPLKSPVRRVSAPIPQGLGKKIKPKVNNKVTRLISPPKLSPSGRPKVMGHKGRMVYADLHYSLADLKRIATTRGKNIKGLRSKESIARKIFS